MDEKIEPPQRWLRPENDLTEGNAYRDGTELLPQRPEEVTPKGVWIDPMYGPTILP